MIKVSVNKLSDNTLKGRGGVSLVTSFWAGSFLIGRPRFHFHILTFEKMIAGIVRGSYFYFYLLLCLIIRFLEEGFLGFCVSVWGELPFIIWGTRARADTHTHVCVRVWTLGYLYTSIRVHIHSYEQGHRIFFSIKRGHQSSLLSSFFSSPSSSSFTSECVAD